MAVCIPSPTLTLFATSTSTTIITTATVTVQTQPDGSVSTVTLPLIITSIITIVDPTSTLYASCSSTPISTISYAQSPSPQPSPTIIVVTTTPGPTVVTQVESSTLGDGVVTVFTATSTFTPSPTVVFESTTIASSSSKSSNIGPIAGGAAGGFLLLLGVVAMTWFILKKCRKPSTVREEEDVVFPYPVTRDRDQTRRLDLNKESRPYEYGHVGRSTQMTAPGSSPAHSPAQSDGRPDSATDLIGASTPGLTPMASASGNIATIHGTLGDVRRQSLHNSTTLPLGAAPPDHYSYSAGSISGASASTAPAPSNVRPLQVINSPPMPLSGSSSGVVPSSHSIPHEQSAWPEKTHARGLSSSTLSSDAQFQGRDGPSGSGPGVVLQGTTSPVPGPIPEEPTDAPPAYVA